VPVLADGRLLSHVLLNFAFLYRNAVSTGGEFVVSVSVSSLSRGEACEAKSLSGDFACLSISCSGSVLSKRVADTIEKDFMSSSSFVEGADLGLAVARGIIHQHGGSLVFSREKEGGVLFVVYLPLYPKPVRKNGKEGSLVVTSGKNELILVVEDDRWARAYLGELLEGAGYRTLEAEDGVAALEKFRNHGDAVALVLCDMILPKMNGWALCRELVGSRNDLKVLFMSGYPLYAIRERGIDVDDINILAKPFKPGDLLRAVSELLSVAEQAPPDGSEGEKACWGLTEEVFSGSDASSSIKETPV
jgi:two-component system cell cycle sensor histidine kinase/response regulator CckA